MAQKNSSGIFSRHGCVHGLQGARLNEASQVPLEHPDLPT